MLENSNTFNLVKITILLFDFLPFHERIVSFEIVSFAHSLIPFFTNISKDKRFARFGRLKLVSKQEAKRNPVEGERQVYETNSHSFPRISIGAVQPRSETRYKFLNAVN